MGGIQEAAHFLKLQGKCVFPLIIYVLGIVFEAPTPTLVLKGNRRTRTSRVWVLQALRVAGWGPSRAWPYGPEAASAVAPGPALEDWGGESRAFYRKMVQK